MRASFEWPALPADRATVGKTAAWLVERATRLARLAIASPMGHQRQRQSWGLAMTVAAIGECMIEISRAADGNARIDFGGDTLNCALYLARLGVPTRYVTALGDDPYSDRMVAAWEAEGIGTELVLRMPGRLPGLYTIETDASGERSFIYWRDMSPARELFTRHEAETILSSLPGYDMIVFSGVTLSLYGEVGRARFFALLDRARAAGTRVAFDTNLRPRNWPDMEVARWAFASLRNRVDIVFAGAEDEALLHGKAGPEEIFARWRDNGASEIVIKRGSKSCLIHHGNSLDEVAPQHIEHIVDTTAAGDSFSAAYLAARLAGRAPAEAAVIGHRLAAAVISNPGAIIPREAMPKGLLG
jgi:2-dehydro-3-deoxygluconokinase